MFIFVDCIPTQQNNGTDMAKLRKRPKGRSGAVPSSSDSSSEGEEEVPDQSPIIPFGQEERSPSVEERQGSPTSKM